MRGIGRYVRGLAAALSEIDAATRERVVALIGPGDAPPAAVTHWTRATRIETWRSQDLGWALGPLGAAMAMRRSGAEAVHATDPRKALGVPFARRRAVTVYDLIPLADPAVWRAIRPHRRAIYRAYLASARSADRVVAISRAAANELVHRLGLPAERIDVVYPVVRAPAVASQRLSAEEPVFLFVGVPDPHKRPDLAIQALARYRDQMGAGRLRFIGPAAAVHEAQLRRLASQAGVAHFIALDGSISEASLEAAYGSATALLAVSRFEGFGLPPVEAAIRGVPVIAVDTAVARETLGLAASFVAADAGALADAMSHAEPPAPPAVAALISRYSPSAVAVALQRSYQALLDG
jgi:glycosyltransferase involved in cell wall biosynthesis